MFGINHCEKVPCIMELITNEQMAISLPEQLIFMEMGLQFLNSHSIKELPVISYSMFLLQHPLMPSHYICLYGNCAVPLHLSVCLVIVRPWIRQNICFNQIWHAITEKEDDSFLRPFGLSLLAHLALADLH